MARSDDGPDEQNDARPRRLSSRDRGFAFFAPIYKGKPAIDNLPPLASAERNRRDKVIEQFHALALVRRAFPP